MEYVIAFTGSRNRPLLDDGATRQSVSAECRDAALAFVNGVSTGWDKLDLALWLTGPYARATGHLPRGERVLGMSPDADVSLEAIGALVTRARGQLLASLEKAALENGSLEFALDAMERGLVRRAVDCDDDIVWLPVDQTRMRLRDRVRSLFAADYLNDTGAYVDLYVCHRCENVVFDPNAKKLGACANHPRLSGVVPKDRAPEDTVVEDRAVGDRA